jgi:hypothetical protein
VAGEQETEQRVRRLAAVRQDPPPTPDGPTPEGTAGLEATLATLDAELRRLDGELQTAERARDAANLVLGGQPTALEAWPAEEQREAAETAITALLEERQPLADRHARLLGYLTPQQQRQREISELAASIEVCERLDSVWPLLDQVLEVINSARPAVARTGGRREIPPSLEELVRAWRPDSMKRYRVRHTIGADTLAEMRERLQRLRAGVP